MAHRQRNLLVRTTFVLVAAMLLAVLMVAGLVKPSFANDELVNTTPDGVASAETTPIETPAVPMAEETPQKEDPAAVEPVVPAAPAPAPAPEPLLDTPAATTPIQEQPLAEAITPAEQLAPIVADPPSGAVAEALVDEVPAPAPSGSVTIHPNPDVPNSGYFWIEVSANQGAIFRVQVYSVEHGGYILLGRSYTETATSEPISKVAELGFADLAPGTIVRGCIAVPFQADLICSSEYTVPGGNEPTDPVQEVIEVTAEAPVFHEAGIGTYGRIELPNTPGLIYTVTPADAKEGSVEVSFTVIAETPERKYVLVGNAEPYKGNLGTYIEPTPVDPNPGDDPANVDSYVSGTFDASGNGTLTAKGEFDRDANVSFVVTDASGNELSSQDFDPWDGKNPLVLDRANLTEHCGKTIKWAWLETSTSENASSQAVLFNGSIDLPACPNPSDGHEHDDNCEVDEDGNHTGGNDGEHNHGGWTPPPGSHNQPGGWNGHVGGPGFYGPGHPDNVVQETVTLTPAGVDVSTGTEYEPLASVGGNSSDLDESWNESSIDDDVLASTGFSVIDWLIAATLALLAGLLVIAVRRRMATVQ